MDIRQLYDALAKADAAGDTEGAAEISRMISQAQSAPRYIEAETPVPYGPQSGMQPDLAPMAPTPEQPYEFSPLNMIKNIPQSALQLGADVTSMFTSPAQTSQAIGEAALGGLSHLGVPGLEQYEPAGSAVGQMYGQRYGDLESILRTLETDPFGFMSDVSLAMSAPAAGVRTAGAVARAPAVTRAGEVMQQTANIADPLNMALAGLGGLRHAVPEALTPEGLYESAMKPSTTLTRAEREALVDTGIREGLTLNQSGLDKADAIGGVLGDSVRDILTDADAKGIKIPVGVVTKYMNETRDKFGGIGFQSADDMRKIDKAIEDLAESVGEHGYFMSPSELQDFKVRTYQRLNYDARLNKPMDEAVEHLQKGSARAARETLEEIAPEIGPTNQRLGDVLGWQGQAERAANRIGNLNPFLMNMATLTAPAGLGAIGYGFGGPAGAAVGSAIGTAASLVMDPRLSPRVAIGLDRARKFAEATGDWAEYLTLLRNALAETGQVESATQ